MMEKARQEREQQTKSQYERSLQEQAQYAQRLMEAKNYGPEAVLRAAGLEPEAKQQKPFTLEDLFKNDEPANEPPQKLTELEKKLEAMDGYIKKLEEERTKEKQTIEHQQMQYYMNEEIQQLESYLNENKDKYEFVDAAREMGSIKDLYNGRVSMYNQGYNPSNDDMLELVEARMEELIRLTAPTKKGRGLIEELFGIRLPAGSESTTLTERSGGDTPAGIGADKVLTDEENKQLALKEAYAARERILKQMG
jgi:hypothetical protein